MKPGLNSPEIYKEVTARIAVITPETKCLWGNMNAAQMMKHLCLDMEIILNRLIVKHGGNFITKTLFKKMILSDLKPPKGGKTIPEIDVIGNNIKVKDFETERAYYLSLVNEFITSKNLAEFHPRLGKMSAEEWYRYAYRHADYHLKQFGA